ncbi:hypothetical protein SKAU_G00402990 [Synaphobranchus kaupii]|uniref:Uncharacterized protein n=1 Tax=Synaphobranchus kaupii TaxID=118154 RepID=A0A9Q1E9E9_SYNKA|nr:hypothetical protein SKAU_G00402990 [Synaphobranchus kaupii]
MTQVSSIWQSRLPGLAQMLTEFICSVPKRGTAKKIREVPCRENTATVAPAPHAREAEGWRLVPVPGIHGGSRLASGGPFTRARGGGNSGRGGEERRIPNPFQESRFTRISSGPGPSHQEQADIFPAALDVYLTFDVAIMRPAAHGLIKTNSPLCSGNSLAPREEEALVDLCGAASRVELAAGFEDLGGVGVIYGYAPLKRRVGTVTICSFWERVTAGWDGGPSILACANRARELNPVRPHAHLVTLQPKSPCVPNLTQKGPSPVTRPFQAPLCRRPVGNMEGQRSF